MNKKILKKYPLVSIVLPTYNGEKYLRQSIQSCLNQTYKNIELIIVNDGSKDNTIGIVNSFKDNRIRLVHHKNTLGIPKSLNSGFRHTKGKYFTWTSDDNFYERKAIKDMLEYLIISKSDFVHADYIFLDEFNYKKIKVNHPDVCNLKKNNCVGPCFLYSNKIKNVIGKYDPELELVEDYDYWIRTSKQFQLSHLNKYLYYFRYHRDSLSSQKNIEADIASVLLKIKYGFINIQRAKQLIVPLLKKRVVDDKSFTGKLINICKMFITNNLINRYYYNKLNFSQTKSKIDELFGF
ncbi:MAG: glycosyltransferase [Patescibacteria group bacterium]|jgi:glycosyltransferase involved in cell wall biosynthesis